MKFKNILVIECNFLWYKSTDEKEMELFWGGEYILFNWDLKLEFSIIKSIANVYQ